MATVVPTFTPAHDVTANCTATVIGGRVVSISATVAADGKLQAAHGAAAGVPFGVAATDQAAGGDVLLYRRGIVPCEVGVAVTAGQRVELAAGGTVAPLGTTAPAAGAPPTTPIGVAVATGAAGALVSVALSF